MALTGVNLNNYALLVSSKDGACDRGPVLVMELTVLLFVALFSFALGLKDKALICVQ